MIFQFHRNEPGDAALLPWSPMRKNTPNPNCETCGSRTTLLRSEPHPKFANMLQRVFVCRCGTLTSEIIAETSRRPVLSAKITTVVQSA
jgi:hypothetical protein